MVAVAKTGPTLLPDQSRLSVGPFLPGRANFGGLRGRLDLIAERVLAIDDETAQRIVDEELRRSSGRFRDLRERWSEHYEVASHHVPTLHRVTRPTKRLLVGAYLTQGYAYEGVALTNPSMVPLGDQTDGAQRFVMSARAIGEGHISSIAFLSGRVDGDGEVSLDPRGQLVSNGQRFGAVYEKRVFSRRLVELGIQQSMADRILGPLYSEFTIDELEDALATLDERDFESDVLTDSTKTVHWLAASSYEIHFDDSVPLSERVLSPAAPIESRGMEDARFVRFIEDDGSMAYYATYTAFDGKRILPQLIRTRDFLQFGIATMSGPMAYHKGIALFPRRIGGEYLALSRHDNESLFLMRSDELRHWGVAELLTRPELDWEAVQIGNCGSPIETEAGWLVVTHGVGAMRRYVLGAILLDLDEPAKVIGRLREPLLEPSEGESNGLVPNVVYSCGSMLVGERLVIPYGFGDYGTRFAVADLSEILSSMV